MHSKDIFNNNYLNGAISLPNSKHQEVKLILNVQLSSNLKAETHKKLFLLEKLRAICFSTLKDTSRDFENKLNGAVR